MTEAGKALAFCVLLAAATPYGAAAAQPDGERQEAPQVRPDGVERQPSAAGRQDPRRAAQRPAALRSVSQPAGSQPAASQASGGLSCVPYARMATGMAVFGNGWQWWDNAAGLYSRGRRPEAGSVLAFRSSGSMSRGHVAVVSRLVGPRHLLIDHANWAGPGIRRGTVMRDVSVVDVSPENDWTAVRVQVGHDPGTFGRTYPTYGFIYNRPDPETAYAGLGRRRSVAFEQVAEFPAGGRARAAAPQGTARAGR